MTTNVNLGFVAAAGGTVNAITATYSPAPTALVDKMLLWFRATGANTSTTPTFSPNGLTARTIVKQGGTALVAGDIPAANAIMEVVYDANNTRWELLNPAGESLLRTEQLDITSAQVKQLFSTPLEIVPAQGVNKAILVISSVGYLLFNTTAYTNVGGTQVQLKTDTATAAQMVYGGNGFLLCTGTMAARGQFQNAPAITDTQIIANKALMVTIGTGDNLSAGDSPIRMYVTYQIIDLS